MNKDLETKMKDLAAKIKDSTIVKESAAKMKESTIVKNVTAKMKDAAAKSAGFWLCFWALVATAAAMLLPFYENPDGGYDYAIPIPLIVFIVKFWYMVLDLGVDGLFFIFHSTVILLGIVLLPVLNVYDLIGRSVWSLFGGKERFKWTRYFATGVSQIVFAVYFLALSALLFREYGSFIPPILYAVAGVLNLRAAKKSKQQ